MFQCHCYVKFLYYKYILFSIEELVNPIQIEDGDMAKLMEMGFSAEQSRNALILSRGDVEKALADILCNADG